MNVCVQYLYTYQSKDILVRFDVGLVSVICFALNVCWEASSPMRMKRTLPTRARSFLMAAVSFGSRTQGIDVSTSSIPGSPIRQARIIRARDVWMWAEGDKFYL